MGKGSGRRPGQGYEDNWNRIFGGKVEPPCKTGSQCIGGKCEQCRFPVEKPFDKQDIVEKLRIRAEIRRNLGRPEPDRIANLCDEAAAEIERLRKYEDYCRKNLLDTGAYD